MISSTGRNWAIFYIHSHSRLLFYFWVYLNFFLGVRSIARRLIVDECVAPYHCIRETMKNRLHIILQWFNIIMLEQIKYTRAFQYSISVYSRNIMQREWDGIGLWYQFCFGIIQKIILNFHVILSGSCTRHNSINKPKTFHHIYINKYNQFVLMFSFSFLFSKFYQWIKMFHQN